MSKQTDLINIPDAITVSGSNVGIGTTSPSSNYGFSKTVEIQGGVNSELSLSQTNNSKDWSFGVGNGNCYQQTNSGQTYSWYTGGVEKLRIQSGGGISFNGDTAAANALHDYEEGTFTPVLEFGGGNTNITYSTRSGFYTKIGNVVYFYAECQLSSRGTSTGNLAIRDLPFSPQRTATSVSVLTGSLSSTNDVMVFMSTNGKINFENRNTGTQSSLTHNNVNSNSTFFVSGTYQTSG